MRVCWSYRVGFSFLYTMAEHQSWEEHKASIRAFEQIIPIGSKWTHRKKPDAQYTIVDLVIDEATDSVSVIYERNGVRIARLASIFLEDVQKPEYQ